MDTLHVQGDAAERLRARLVAKQREMGLSDEKFGALLGWHRVRWNGVKRGKVHVTAGMCGPIVRAFPTLADDVVAALSEMSLASVA